MPKRGSENGARAQKPWADSTPERNGFRWLSLDAVDGVLVHDAPGGEPLDQATSDDATKDAVLVQATHSIFSHRPSGFGHLENDVVPPSHLLELTKGVVGDRGVRT